MKTYAIGDLHGRVDLLNAALRFIGYEPCKIVFLGDYIDRGPDSAKVVARLRAGPTEGQEWVCLRGNHEDMMVDAILGEGLDQWLMNGGDATCASYAMSDDLLDDVEWMKSLPVMYEDDRFVYVHAGLFEGREDDRNITGWYRYRGAKGEAYKGKTVVHGHTPVDHPEIFSERVNIDIGAAFSGRLAIFHAHNSNTFTFTIIQGS